ncbi:hypothetical protein Val02_33670 [Virgisporangium aliadipatigenens]|uniref:Uncharacterized protein n=1 Tax=Virgisporangium aliadipatigenens TaxID=741659 RepID=A0A8J4DQX7_9ACTN|nr:hypothetical protein [Virgisporangium aliadipatigenens]GIJ46481.1 hypothetical protein Val02_33670 [Virgisporangium aliadipatigenens]
MAPAGLLREACSPELYRRNPFRTAGLPVGVPTALVRQRLAGDPAADRLEEPLARLLDGFFWYRADPALDALAAGDIAGTRARWEAAAGTDPVARHNLAVLCHSTALEHSAGDFFPDDLWPDAYRHWLALRETDAAWTPQLRRVRRILPLALALVNARLAVDALAAGGPVEPALRHWRLPFEAGLPEGVAERAARIAAAPLRARVAAAREAVDDGTPAEAEAALRAAVIPLTTLQLLDPTQDDPVELFLRAAARHSSSGAWASARDLLALAAPLARTAAGVDAVQRQLRAAEQELRVREAVEAYRRRKLREESEARSARAAHEAAEERRARAAREAAARRAEALRMAAQRQVMESRRRTRAARTGEPQRATPPPPAPPVPGPRRDASTDRAARNLLAFAVDWDGCHYCQRVRRSPRHDHPVSLARGADVATVSVPRCLPCRWRQTGRACLGLVLMAFTVLIVVIVTPAAARWVSWTAVAVGLVWTVTGLLAVRRGAKARWLHTLTYPPVADLWREGWRRH